MTSSFRWTFFAAFFALSVPVRAEPLATADVSVDAAAQGTPLARIWPYYGYDEVNYTTLPEGKALLERLAAAHSAPVHVRTHFLFNNGDGEPAMKWGSTNVYSEDSNGNPVYSWALTDGILDALTAAGTFPFVELGFMPEALSSHPTPYRNSAVNMLDGGCFYPPTDPAKWAELIRAWARHAKERYPDVEAKWLWELWNEPDLGYWRGSFEEYATLYDYTESALHEVLPSAPLGGPAVAGAGSLFLKQFLKHCATGANALTGNSGTRLDLVSFHAKGGVTALADRIQLDLGNQLRLHRVGFEAVAAFSQFKSTPIYITEADPDGCAACPVSSVPADAYRNSTAYGAYELSMMKHSLELGAELGVNLQGVLTWAFTFPGTPYFAGYRTLTTNGIQLPVMSAFQLLGRLAGTRVPLTSSAALALADVLEGGVRGQPEIDGIATRDGASIQALVWNYHDDIVTAAATPVHLSIKVPADFGARARVSHLRVDESHGDAYSAWVSQGMPVSPSPAQIADLQRAMTPSALVPDRSVAVSDDGLVSVDFELPRFGVSLVTLRPALDEGDGGAGGAVGQERVGGGCGCRVGGSAKGATRCAMLVAALLAGAARRARRRNRT
ncbi:MAG TPA: hypothetical protein VG937_32145 [Polyangiaceae bacterium]|nr:hypothetical protein [Polyangiaceae bacterium]